MKRTVVLLALIETLVFSQTTVNPDISFLGDILAKGDKELLALSTSGLEIAAQGYVNPFARADLFLHIHDGEGAVEVEEAFLTVERGLPLNLGLRAGKFRPDFGKINREHAHTYHYILASRPVQALLGEEMWSSAGAELSTLAPLPWYSKLSLSAMQNGMGGHGHDEHSHDKNEGNRELYDDEKWSEKKEEDNGNTGVVAFRFSNFFELNDISHIETGLNHYRAINESEGTVSGVDMKFKWRPDKYRSFTVQGEVMQNSGKEEHEEEKYHEEHLSEEHEGTTTIAYGWLNMQINKVWNAGFIIDYASEMDEAPYNSFGFFVGFSPVEESSVLRVRLHQEYHGDEDPVFSVVGQLIWSLGPHKPHRF